MIEKNKKLLFLCDYYSLVICTECRFRLVITTERKYAFSSNELMRCTYVRMCVYSRARALGALD